MARPSVGLADLPGEILQDIHLFALNPSLPVACRQFAHVLSGSPTYVARYFIALYGARGADELIARALPHRIVDVGVAREIARLWALDIGGGGSGGGTCSGSPARALRCGELPRRIFRARPAPGAPAIDPLVPYLVDELGADVNGRNGYALARAVLNGNGALVRFLLARGADPGLKGSLAVQAAIERGDLGMVKLLVERMDGQAAGAGAEGKSTVKRKRESEGTDADAGNANAGDGGAAGAHKRARAKKARLDDRVRIDAALVEKAMKRKANDIVDYFVYEKGAMPKLRNIMAMSEPLARSPVSTPSKEGPRRSLG
ncbi:hypothetical protein Q5752_004462 [Cryptotrichosporon argae]